MEINKNLHLKAALGVRPARFIFKATCCRCFCCPVEPWVILCLCLATRWEQKHARSLVLIFSPLHSTNQSCHGGQNQLCEWMEVLLRNGSVAVNITAAAHPMGPESHWHGIISVQMRFIFLPNADFYASLSIHLHCSLNSLQRVTHSSSVMYVIFFM